MSKIWVTMLDGSTKEIVRIGLAQQRFMPTDPSVFLRLVSSFCSPFCLFPFFACDRVGTSKFGLQDENDYDDSNALEVSSTRYTIRRGAICCMETIRV